MQAAVCSAYGPPEVLRIRSVATPVPGPREVRIRVRATAVTSSDCYVRGLELSSAYRLLARLALGWNAPRQPILGMVLSGEIDAVGAGATRFSAGDPVFGMAFKRFGAYAQYVCWPETALLAERPDGLCDAEAAALPLSLIHISEPTRPY
jgi:NADPH:quinone reductase-like Zn-dependent oxidoreductase